MQGHSCGNIAGRRLFCYGSGGEYEHGSLIGHQTAKDTLRSLFRDPLIQVGQNSQFPQFFRIQPLDPLSVDSQALSPNRIGAQTSLVFLLTAVQFCTRNSEVKVHHLAGPGHGPENASGDVGAR